MTTPDDNGRAYAETWLRMLRKFERFGSLKDMTGLDALPTDAEGVDAFMTNVALQNARNLRVRHLNEVSVDDPEEDLNAFLVAFRQRLSELLLAH